MKGIAAPDPLRRHGLPAALAAREGGGDPGDPGVAQVASSSAGTPFSPSSSVSHGPLAFSGCMRARGSGSFPTLTRMACPVAVAASTCVGAGSS
jgi:hypothetical protein